jgi:hypothetical protein
MKQASRFGQRVRKAVGTLKAPVQKFWRSWFEEKAR